MPSRFHCVGFVVLLLVIGCRSTPHKPGVPDAARPVAVKKSADPVVRNNTASLLYDLLGDEKDVGKVLVIKSAGPELSALVKSIASAAHDGRDTLDSLAAADGSLHLHRLDLPRGEVAARDASSKTMEHALLHSSGADFEFQLLVAQVQALSYGAHLAQVAAANETNADHSRQLASLGDHLNNLYQIAMEQLRRAR